MWEKVVNRLVSVKSIISISLTLVFCYMAIIGLVAPELFIPIFTMVVSFYFGTQFEKRNQEKEKTE